MTAVEIRTKLDKLDVEIAEVQAAYNAGRDARNLGFKSVSTVLEDLVQYQADVAYGRRAPDEAELCRLSQEVADAIKARGLLFVPMERSRPGNALRLFDPEPVRQHAAVEQRLRRLTAERDQLAVTYADVLKEADRRERMDAVRAALGADDPDALTSALAELPASRPSSSAALTTDDVTVTA